MKRSLSELLARAPHSAEAESDFFAELLQATIYALRPLSDDHPRVRLTMYQNPTTKQFFIPLFTDEDKAILSAAGVWRLLSAPGRKMLEITQGALVVINPNDEHCLLLPHEVEKLLVTGRIT